MTRSDVERYIFDTYGITPDYPWEKYPGYAVYRHNGNNKWLAVVMDLPARRFGIDRDGTVEVMNLKCDPILIDMLHYKDGFFPAYHMNKLNWVSVLLGNTVPDEEIKKLIEISFDLTKIKIKSKGCD